MINCITTKFIQPGFHTSTSLENVPLNSAYRKPVNDDVDALQRVHAIYSATVNQDRLNHLRILNTHHHLTDKDHWIHPSLLRKVAEELGKDWKKLGREMRLKESKIELIAAKGSDDLYEMAYQVLVTWRQHMGHQANLNNLHIHLKSIERNDIVETISRMSHPSYYSQMSNKESSQEDKNKKEHGTDLLTEVREKLIDEYQALEMKGLPWMQTLVLTLDEYYVDITLTGMNNRGTEIHSDSINIEDIFIPNAKSNKLSRILIEGGPGMGKSTLAAKLAYDWANKLDYLKRFDLVVLLPLRYFNGELKDVICNAVQIREQDYEHMLRIFEDKSKDILFIMDGYDEISTETEGVVLPMLQGEVYSHTIILVTSRTGKFSTNQEETHTLRRQINADFSPSVTHFIQKRFHVKGFSPNQQNTFIERHTTTCSEKEKEKIMLKFEKMVDKEFLKCPLFLLMVIVTFTANYKVENASETKTDLYKQVFNFVIRRYLSKIMSNRVPDIDLFSYIDSTKPLHIDLMEQFSKFSLWAVCVNKFSFSREEILKDATFDPRILQLGFLTQSVTLTWLHEKLEYEPVHKSLLEFSAAYGLWLRFKEQNGHTKQWVNDVVSVLPASNSSMCLAFLLGLMGEKADILFNVLLPYKGYFHCEFSTLYSGLLETGLNNLILKIVTPFLPPIWRITWENTDSDFYSSKTHKAIVRCGLQGGSIKQVVWYLQYDACMPNDLEVDTLVISIDNTTKENNQEIYEKQSSLKCKHLWYRFRQFLEFGSTKCSFKHLIKVSDFERLSVSVQKIMMSDVNYFLTKGTLKNKPLYWFRAILTDNDPKLTDGIVQLIRDKTVKRLGLEVDAFIQHTPVIDKLLLAAAESPELKAFTLDLTYSPLLSPYGLMDLMSVDIGDLCQEGTKSWEWVHLDGVKVLCRTEPKKHFSIKCFHLPLTTDSETNVIQHCNVESLTCPATLLRGCRDSWILCDTLTELSIGIDGLLIRKGVSNFLKTFRNLQTLALILMPNRDLTRSVEDWLIGSQNGLCLKGIEIWEIVENFKLAKKLVKGIARCLQAYLPSENTQANAIQVQYLMVNCVAVSNVIFMMQMTTFTDIINILKQPLREQRLPRLEIVPTAVSRHGIMWRFSLNDLFYDFPFSDGFRVGFDFWGERKDDTIKSKMMNDQHPRSFERLFVTYSYSQ